MAPITSDRRTATSVVTPEAVSAVATMARSSHESHASARHIAATAAACSGRISWMRSCSTTIASGSHARGARVPDESGGVRGS
jgi:hypothetical protein